MKQVFPVGGSRDAVYQFLQGRGWVMSSWSDKHWHKGESETLQVYGSGSMARITLVGQLVFDGPLGDIPDA